MTNTIQESVDVRVNVGPLLTPLRRFTLDPPRFGCGHAASSVPPITGDSPGPSLKFPTLNRWVDLRQGPPDRGGAPSTLAVLTPTSIEGAPLPCSHREKTWKPTC